MELEINRLSREAEMKSLLNARKCVTIDIRSPEEESIPWYWSVPHGNGNREFIIVHVARIKSLSYYRPRLIAAILDVSTRTGWARKDALLRLWFNSFSPSPSCNIYRFTTDLPSKSSTQLATEKNAVPGSLSRSQLSSPMEIRTPAVRAHDDP